MANSDQDFITNRQRKFQDTLSVVLGDWTRKNEFLDYFADSGFVYTDFDVNTTLTDKAGLEGFASGMADSGSDWTISTRSISGTKNEYDAGFKLAKEAPFLPGATVGTEAKLVGCPVTWWNEDGKIVRNHDYGKFVTGGSQVGERDHRG
ncbi:MAG: hypothetical protein M1820_006792 [Bogoriella megaspora]|nr:MAG: hypothetical protein M1820_006792 [Bogoriella megaspora]